MPPRQETLGRRNRPVRTEPMGIPGPWDPSEGIPGMIGRRPRDVVSLYALGQFDRQEKQHGIHHPPIQLAAIWSSVVLEKGPGRRDDIKLLFGIGEEELARMLQSVGPIHREVYREKLTYVREQIHKGTREGVETKSILSGILKDMGFINAEIERILGLGSGYVRNYLNRR